MDALSHTLLAFILGKALQLDTNLQFLLIVSSISLDIDAISMRSREAAFRSHRGPVHSILAALLASTIISLGYTIFMRLPTTALLSVIPICLTGALSHLILDLFTTGNMPALWPLSRRNLALNLTYYIDPTNLGALIIAALLTICTRTDVNAALTVAAATVAFLTTSFGARIYAKHAATKTVKELNAGAPSEIITLPTLRPDRWWIVKKTPFENGYRYEIHQIDHIHKRILSKEIIKSPYINYSGPVELPIDSPQKAVAHSRRDKRISSSIEKFLLPAAAATSTDDKKTWQAFWYDASMQMGKTNRAGILANVNNDGTVTIDEHWARRTK